MIRLVIADDYAPLLAAARLDRFETLAYEEIGEVIKRKPGREVRRIVAKLPEETRVFYLRRVAAEPMGNIVKSLLRFQPAGAPCMREAKMIRALQAQGIATMKAAAWGERRWLGLPRESFLLAEEVCGEELDGLFRRADAKLRRRVVVALGTLLGRLHQVGFFDRLRLRDLICTDWGDPVQLVLIDRETTHTERRRVTMDRCCDSLARCWCKLLQTGHRFLRVEIVRFLRAYFAVMSKPKQQKEWIKKINERIAVLTQHGGKYENLT